MEERKGFEQDDPILSANYPEFIAAIDGNDAEISRFVQQKLGPSSNEVRDKYLKKRFDGKSLLHFAIEKCTWDTITKLIDTGFDPRTQAANGQDVLMMAVVHRRLDILESLVTHLGDELSREVKKTDYKGNTVLHLSVLAGKPSVVAFLTGLQAIKDIVNLGKGEAGTALHRAAACKHADIVDIAGLLNKIGAEVEVTNQDKQTPLHVACAHNNAPMVEDFLLNHNANKNATDKYMQTPLHLAAKADAPDAIEMLFTIGEPPNLTAETFENAKEGYFAHPPLHSAVFAGAEKAVEKLKEKGADIDARDCLGRAVFPIACGQGSLSLVNLLDGYKPTRQIKDNEGFHALHYACRNRTSDGPEIVTKLINFNFPIEAMAGPEDGKNSERQLTPFLVACMVGRPDVLDVLVKAKVNKKATQYVKYNRTTDELDGLKVAIKGDNTDAMEYLVNKNIFKIDIETILEDSGSLTPAGVLLRLAVTSGSSKAVTFLLDCGADIDAQDQYKKTALHYAAQFGKAACIKVLVERGADAQIRDRSTKLSSGRTPVDLALIKKKPKIAEYINELVLRQKTLLKRLPHETSELTRRVENLEGMIVSLEEILRNLSSAGKQFSSVNTAPKSTHFMRPPSPSQLPPPQDDNNNNNNRPGP